MNKQEVVEKIKKIEGLNILDKIINFDSEMVSKKKVLNIIKQLDEPEKPVVPKFVAEWIESQKESFSDSSAIDMYDNLTLDNNGGYYHEVWLWVIAHHHDFIKAWHDGYTVEKEPGYTVKIKGIEEYASNLNINLRNQEWFFGSKVDIGRFRTRHTRKELEDAGFGWVFNCEGIEVKEVE